MQISSGWLQNMYGCRLQKNQWWRPDHRYCEEKMNNMSINWKMDEYLVRYIYIPRFATLLCNSWTVRGAHSCYYITNRYFGPVVWKKEKRIESIYSERFFVQLILRHGTQHNSREKQEREKSSVGSAPVNLPPAKPVDIQFIGQVGLVQGVENAVVHQLNPVYHPLELQTQKKIQKRKWETHTWLEAEKKDRKKGLTGLMSMLRRSPSQYSMYFQRKNMQSQGPACLGRSIIGLLQCSKQGNLLLVTLWNAALMIGILL